MIFKINRPQSFAIVKENDITDQYFFLFFTILILILLYQPTKEINKMIIKYLSKSKKQIKPLK